MSEKPDSFGEVTAIVSNLIETSKQMAETIPKHRTEIFAAQAAILAMIEQLSAAGLIDAGQLAKRTRDLVEQTMGARWKRYTQANGFLKNLDALGGEGPHQPPRGRGPKLIVDND
jgi:hypothetical protein